MCQPLLQKGLYAWYQTPLSLKSHSNFQSHITQRPGCSGWHQSEVPPTQKTKCGPSLYITDARPFLDYASSIWSTGYAGDIKLLELVQRCWTIQIHNIAHLPYQLRLSRLNLYTVKGRLICTYPIQCYKIFHDPSPIKLHNQFLPSPSRRTRGHPFKIFVPHVSTEARKHFYAHQWNYSPVKLYSSINHWGTLHRKNFKSSWETPCSAPKILP